MADNCVDTVTKKCKNNTWNTMLKSERDKEPQDSRKAERPGVREVRLEAAHAANTGGGRG
ncbi:hypothetical protein J6590_007048 [Homalodisca vitripennis]|nr:hypothetical protein J6590_007048 [Homalodisca vitripennis]